MVKMKPLPSSSVLRKRPWLTADLGIRIKATEGDTGSISGVTYSGITLSEISGYVEKKEKNETNANQICC